MEDSAITDSKTWKSRVVYEKARKTQILSVSKKGHSRVVGPRGRVGENPKARDNGPWAPDMPHK